MITNESMGRTNAMCTMRRDVYLPVHSMHDALSHEGFLVEATVFICCHAGVAWPGSIYILMNTLNGRSHFARYRNSSIYFFCRCSSQSKTD
jgi:hypothetical protein